MEPENGPPFWKSIIFRFKILIFRGVMNIRLLADGQLGAPSCSKWLFGRKAEYGPLPSSLECIVWNNESLDLFSDAKVVNKKAAKTCKTSKVDLRKKTYFLPRHFWRWFLFPRLGKVSSLEGTILRTCLNIFTYEKSKISNNIPKRLKYIWGAPTKRLHVNRWFCSLDSIETNPLGSFRDFTFLISLRFVSWLPQQTEYQEKMNMIRWYTLQVMDITEMIPKK